MHADAEEGDREANHQGNEECFEQKTTDASARPSVCHEAILLGNQQNACKLNQLGVLAEVVAELYRLTSQNYCRGRG